MTRPAASTALPTALDPSSEGAKSKLLTPFEIETVVSAVEADSPAQFQSAITQISLAAPWPESRVVIGSGAELGLFCFVARATSIPCFSWLVGA